MKQTLLLVLFISILPFAGCSSSKDEEAKPSSTQEHNIQLPPGECLRVTIHAPKIFILNRNTGKEMEYSGQTELLVPPGNTIRFRVEGGTLPFEKEGIYYKVKVVEEMDIVSISSIG